MWKIFNDFKKKNFWFKANIFIMFFFTNYNRSRSLNFVCFFDFLFFFIRKLFVQICNCVEATFNWIKFISFSFFEIFIVRIFETFFYENEQIFFQYFQYWKSFFRRFFDWTYWHFADIIFFKYINEKSELNNSFLSNSIKKLFTDFSTF